MDRFYCRYCGAWSHIGDVIKVHERICKDRTKIPVEPAAVMHERTCTVCKKMFLTNSASIEICPTCYA